MVYKCRDCGTEINEGEYKTFGVCDNCWDKAYPRPKPEATDAVLDDVAIDKRIYFSRVSDMVIGSWSKDERRAMMYIAGQIYENFVVSKK